MFEKQVEVTPFAVALETETRILNYVDLNKFSNQVANYLRTLGYTVGDRIGIYMSRDIEMIAAMLAVLKIGGVYVPMDTGLPVYRIQNIITDGGLKALFAD